MLNPILWAALIIAVFIGAIRLDNHIVGGGSGSSDVCSIFNQ